MAKDIFLKDNKNFSTVVSSLSINNFLVNKKFMTGHSLYLKNEKVIAGPDFDYNLNSEGFRSKSFDQFNLNKTNILFAGCSHTFGSGLPEEYVWCSKLIKRMSDSNPELDLDSYNIGVPGGPASAIIKNILVFLKKIGKPEYIFMLLPETSRSIRWDGSLYSSVSYYPNPDAFSDFTKDYSNNYIHEDALFFESIMIYFLEELCKSLGINLIWSSTIPLQNDAYESLGFKNFVNISENLKDYYLKTVQDVKKYGGPYKEYEKQYPYLLDKMQKKNINSDPYWEIASDGAHFGSYCHQFMADKFFKEIGEQLKNE
jgi:hypothetical protein